MSERRATTASLRTRESPGAEGPGDLTGQARRVRRVFFIFNTLFIACGIALLIISLISILREAKLDSVLTVKRLVSINTILFFSGMAAIILGSLGTYAARTSSRGALLCYSVLTSVVFFFIMSIIILSLSKDLKVNLMISLTKNLENASPKKMSSLIFWNHLQLNDHCCGFGSGRKSWTIWMNNEYINPDNETDFLPESCCGRSIFILNDESSSKKLIDLEEGLKVSPVRDPSLPRCRSNSTDLYRADCFKIIFDTYHGSSRVVFGVTLFFAFVTISCFAFSVWTLVLIF